MYNRFNMNSVFSIFIIIMLIQGLFSYTYEELLITLYILPGLVLGLTVHEFAHAKMSDRLGDPTPERENRLTLNPLNHLDPIGTICLLFAGFGWGKPVRIDPTYYRDPAKDSMKVALAGPVSNFILSFVLIFIYALLYYLVPEGKIINIVLTVISLAAQINLSLGVFNLLPFPPLDGSKIFGYFLKGKAKAFLWNLEQYSWIILIILFATKLPSIIITPVVSKILEAMCFVVQKIILLFI